MASNKKFKESLPKVEEPEMLSKINAHFFPDHERVLQTFYYLKGEIGESNVTPILEGIIEANSPAFEYSEDDDGNEIIEEAPRPDVINILITSPGGDMAYAFALIEVIKGSKIPIRTIAIGEAASAALCILMAGHQRASTKYTSLMSHVFSTGTEGNYHELKNAVSQMDTYFHKMMMLYQECTGLSEEVIRNRLLTHSDFWMTAQLAHDHNIIDIVSDLS